MEKKMIRLVNLGDQISCDERKQFAWFDTISDKFLTFSETQAWFRWKDFVQDFEDDEDYAINQITSRNLRRFEQLFYYIKHK